MPALYDASPLKRELIEGVDLLVVREPAGGLYYGERGTSDGRAFDTMVYTVEEIERIARTAFEAAKSRVTSVDKANVLEVMGLWRDVMTQLGKQYPDVELSHLYVDNAAMQMMPRPTHFDVLVMENMFGDILSDVSVGAHRLDRPAAIRLHCGDNLGCTSRSTARRPTSPARGRPTRSA